jgi:ArsR family transcriptional regulator, arsenate/arsenite/antimonite-responsive transcriptional repressor
VAAYSHPIALTDAPPPGLVERSSALLGAIAHPKRLALVAALARRERCVCELVDLLGLPQPLVSHHLAALRAAGLVRDRRDAHWVYYSLVPETLDELRSGLGALLGGGALPAEAAYGANAGCAPPGRG